MTETELLQRIYSHTGGEEKSKLYKPLVIAQLDLALTDLARYLIDMDSELAKKLITSVANQSWSSSSFSAPSNMLFHGQKPVVRLDLGGTLAFQVSDRDKLDMVTGMANIYYALEGKTFYIKHPSATTSGNNLNLRYYKIPAIADIDEEMTNLLVTLLLQRLGLTQSNQQDGQKQPDTQNSQ